MIWKAENVVDRRRPKRIDRLRIVADDGDAVAILPEVLQDLRLQHVRVLILVDEDVIELAADLGREPLVAHHRVPVEQQVVVVERLIRELLVHIRAIQLGELRLPFGAPWKERVERLGERPLRVDAMRVDGEARVFARKALLDFREAELVAQHVHQIGGVAAIEHAEARVETDGGGMAANQSIRDRVKGAGPGDAAPVPCDGFQAPGPASPSTAHDALRAARHFERGAACEGEEQNALGFGARQHEMRHSVRERVGLARSRAGNDEQGTRAELRGFLLFGFSASMADTWDTA